MQVRRATNHGVRHPINGVVDHTVNLKQAELDNGGRDQSPRGFVVRQAEGFGRAVRLGVDGLHRPIRRRRGEESIGQGLAFGVADARLGERRQYRVKAGISRGLGSLWLLLQRRSHSSSSRLGRAVVLLLLFCICCFRNCWWVMGDPIERRI